jgi:DNA-binding response OmpR family regulator
MIRTYLIVEDNQQKVEQIVSQLKLEKHHLFVVRNAAMAKHLLDILPGLLTLVLDGELDPGCGTGLEILEYATAKHCDKIVAVIANSFAKSMNEAMITRATQYRIPARLASEMGR